MLVLYVLFVVVLSAPVTDEESKARWVEGGRPGALGSPGTLERTEGLGENRISGKSILLSPLQAQAGPETCQETQSQQLGSQLTTNPTPSPLDTSPRRPPGPVTSPASPSLSSPGKGQPGPGAGQEVWLQCPLQLFTALLLPSRSAG